MMDELRVSLAPRLSSVRSLAQMVEGFGDANELPEQKIYMINLALDELITNTVSYGLQGVEQPQIEITVKVDDAAVVLTVVDNGRRFDPTQDTGPDLSSDIDDRPVGGLGLHLIKSFADRMKYEYVDGKNRLTLEHDLVRAGG
ncbi:MAG: ATP-binding protein [Gemmatimonadota bacterium]|nr:ATP-binding protein [Gemmatimonadota bacterium]